MERQQCDQFGRLLKVLGGKVSYKSSPNIWRLIVIFFKISILKEKLLCLLFGHLRENLDFVLLHLVTLKDSNRKLSNKENNICNVKKTHYKGETMVKWIHLCQQTCGPRFEYPYRAQHLCSAF